MRETPRITYINTPPLSKTVNMQPLLKNIKVSAGLKLVVYVERIRKN
jgi:hypothetical protein